MITGDVYSSYEEMKADMLKIYDKEIVQFKADEFFLINNEIVLYKYLNHQCPINYTPYGCGYLIGKNDLIKFLQYHL